MDTVGLSDLVGFLDALPEDAFKGTLIEHYLTHRRLDAASLGSFCCFKTDSYGRNLIAKNRFYELLILTWMPGQRTPIHDHFGQRCWMLVHSGELTLKNYEPPKESISSLVSLGGSEKVRAGQHCYVDDSIAVHSITNASAEPAVSIHLYAGPVPQCRIYDEKSRCFELTTLSYSNDFSSFFLDEALSENPQLRS